MHFSENGKIRFVPAVLSRKEDVAKVILVNFFSIVVYTCRNTIFPLVY